MTRTITSLLLLLLILYSIINVIHSKYEPQKQRWLQQASLYELQSKQKEYPMVESSSPFHKTTQVTPFDAISSPTFNSDSFTRLFYQYKDSTTPRTAAATALSKRDRRNIVPTFIATLSPDEVRVQWEAPCFRKNEGYLKFNKQARTFTITFTSQNATSYLCSDWYLFATRETFHIKAAVLHGTHTLTLTNLLDSDISFIMNNGLFGFVFEDGLLGTVIDSYAAILALYDTYFQKDKIQFLQDNMPDFNFEKRPYNYTPVDETEISNGDLLAVVTLSGLDLILMYGTGSHIGHVATTLWIPVADNKTELYVVEAYDVGIQKTPYAKWIAAHAADGRVVILGKLRKEFSQKLDVQKALSFYFSHEGLPYGYQNIAFAWIDTVAGNYPTPLDEHIMPSALTIFARLSSNWLQTIFIEGFNQRFVNVLNVDKSCKDMECVFAVTDSVNTTLQELLTIPERDEWKYNGHPAMVCSVFIMSLFKESGVLDGYDIQASEFTPKDLYMLDVWDKNWTRPDICKKNGDNYPYCQMLGPWYWPLPDYAQFSSVPLYSHMNEKCEAMPPTYLRGPASC
jgi:hypothetical protein